MGTLDAVTNSLPSMSATADFLFNMVLVLVVLGALGFSAFMIIRNKQFKYRVTILEELSDGATMIAHDKGRIKKRHDKTMVFVLRRFKDAVMPPPPDNAMLPNNKGGKEIFIKKFGNGVYDYYAMGVSLKGVQVYLTPFLTSRQNWISTEIKRAFAKYGGFWEKYGALVILGSMAIIAGIMMIIIFKMNQDTADVLAKGMTQIASAMEAFKTTAIQQIETTPPGV